MQYRLHNEDYYITQHTGLLKGTLMSTLHFLLLVPDPNPGIAAKLSQDYNHADFPGSYPTEGQVYTYTPLITKSHATVCCLLARCDSEGPEVAHQSRGQQLDPHLLLSSGKAMNPHVAHGGSDQHRA